MTPHLAGWAWYADSNSAIAQQLVIDVYHLRILDKETNNVEVLSYIKAMTEARQLQLQLQLQLDTAKNTEEHSKRDKRKSRIILTKTQNMNIAAAQKPGTKKGG